MIYKSSDMMRQLKEISMLIGKTTRKKLLEVKMKKNVKTRQPNVQPPDFIRPQPPRCPEGPTAGPIGLSDLPTSVL